MEIKKRPYGLRNLEFYMKGMLKNVDIIDIVYSNYGCIISIVMAFMAWFGFFSLDISGLQSVKPRVNYPSCV